MNFSFGNIDAIRQLGFVGFMPISSLQSSGCCELPNERGVYAVLRANAARPRFFNESKGGHFKGKNPTVDITDLDRKWVEDTVVVYFGKAGPAKRRNIRTRVMQYMRFGQGQAVGHWGGRYIWQLLHSGSLLVCWKTTLDFAPREAEKALLRKFEATYHKLPFANLNH